MTAPATTARAAAEQPGAAGLPQLLVPDVARHGVTVLALRLAGSLAGSEPVGRVDQLVAGRPVHVHVTDNLVSDSADGAARWVEELAERCPVSLTLHDVPQAEEEPARRRTRERAYARMVAAARGVACNSHHEAAALRRFCPAGRPAVVPLPVDRDPLRRPPRPGDDVAVLGFFYPGKGHDEVAQALLALPGRSTPPTLTVLGGPSRGHEADLAGFVAGWRRRGLRVQVTGYLDDRALTARCTDVGVPVVAHRQVSASGSLGSWLAAGRRPLVRAGGYAAEVAALRPGTVHLYDGADLAAALAQALAEPSLTCLPDDVPLRPGLADVAEAYLAWWRSLPW